MVDFNPILALAFKQNPLLMSDFKSDRIRTKNSLSDFESNSLIWFDDQDCLSLHLTHLKSFWIVWILKLAQKPVQSVWDNVTHPCQLAFCKISKKGWNLKKFRFENCLNLGFTWISVFRTLMYFKSRHSTVNVRKQHFSSFWPPQMSGFQTAKS